MTMADLDPDPWPPKSIADVLLPPASPFTPSPSNLLTFNSATPSLQSCQDTTAPGTQSYRTSYDEFSLPTTKIDHDPDDRSANNLCIQNQQAQITKLCKSTLKVIKQEPDYLLDPPHQHYKPPTARQPHTHNTQCPSPSTCPMPLPVNKNTTINLLILGADTARAEALPGIHAR